MDGKHTVDDNEVLLQAALWFEDEQDAWVINDMRNAIDVLSLRIF